MLFKNLNETDEAEYRQWARDNYCVGDDINTLWHPVVRDECAKINAQSVINTNGTSLRGHFKMPYAKLVELIGEPNAMSDGYKTDVEWAFKRDGVVATIYNWKNGPNYIGRGTIEDIDQWNVGGHSSDAMDVVSALLMQQ